MILYDGAGNLNWQQLRYCENPVKVPFIRTLFVDYHACEQLNIAYQPPLFPANDSPGVCVCIYIYIGKEDVG